MRRALVVGVTLWLMLLAPRAVAHADGDRVLLDVTIRAYPRAVSGLCMHLDTGTVLASVAVDDATEQTVYYTLAPESRFRQNSTATVKTGDPFTHTMTVTDGAYCLTLAYMAGNASPPPDPSTPPLNVAVKLIWFPPPA